MAPMSTGSQPGKIECPHCGAMIKSPGLAAGSGVNCPKCGSGFRVGERSEGSGFGVQGSERKEPGDRGQETGGAAVQGPRPKVKTRLVAKPVPEPPPAPGTAAEARQGTGVRSHEPENPQSATPNPKSAKPDVLVDPNLIAPPPPKVKAKPKEVAVVCPVCGTRTYAPLEKIGETIKCPDCYSRIEVPPLKGEPVAKQAGPTLEGTENFEMSEVVERPKYRPLQAARGEYEVLSALDPATIEQRLTVPSEMQRAKKGERGAGSGNPRTTGTAAASGGAEAGEISLEPVAERPEIARDPRTILPQPELEPENELYDGRYDDGVIGDMVDPRSPDAWKRAPLLYGIVEFLFFGSTLLRLVMFAFGLAVVATIVRIGIVAAQESPVLLMFVIWGGIPLGGVWLLSFAAAAQAIVEATANGEKEVKTWPDWNVFGWFMPATYMVVAALISSAPGVAVAVGTYAANLADPLMAAFGIGAPIVISWLVLFPVVLFSMLIEESLFAIISSQTMSSLKNAADAWVIFYAYSILVALLGMAAGAMLVQGFPVSALGAAASVAVLMLYARLVGRLMWVSGEREKGRARGQGSGVRRQ